MSSFDPQLALLVDAAEAAYERVRIEIVDRLPPPARIDVDRLDLRQRGALDDLCRAESALARYRERAYR